MFPNCLLELTNRCSHLWVTHFTRKNRLLTQGTQIASFTLTEQSGINDAHTVCPVAETSLLLSESSSAIFAQVVANDFAPSKSRCLQGLLSEYKDIFDLSAAPLGRVNAVKNIINTRAASSLEASHIVCRP